MAQRGLLVGGHGQGQQLMASQPGPGQQRRAAGVGVLLRQAQDGEPSAAGGRDDPGGRVGPPGYQGSALVRWSLRRRESINRASVLADGRLVSGVNALVGGAASLPLEDGRSALDVRVDARSS